MKIAVFISGNGSNLQAMIDAIEDRALDAEIVCVISSNLKAGGIQRAEDHGIPVMAMDKFNYENPEFADSKILDFLRVKDAEYIVMAGYMRMITKCLLDAYPNKILNIHPALLPSFKGAHAIKDAWEAGVKVTGVTVHFANEDYDEGPIIAQRAVPVLESDDIYSLEARIHEVEHDLYVEVLQQLSENRITIKNNRVSIEE